MFFFDYWTVFSTLIQFIHELAPRSLWFLNKKLTDQSTSWKRPTISSVETANIETIVFSFYADVIAFGSWGIFFFRMTAFYEWVSLWTGSLSGEKNSKEREGKLFPFPFPLFPFPNSPLDQRPVHRLRMSASIFGKGRAEQTPVYYSNTINALFISQLHLVV